MNLFNLLNKNIKTDRKRYLFHKNNERLLNKFTKATTKKFLMN